MPICYSTYADPAHRASIWEVPLRARAYENGVYVLACNRVGVEGERHHLGRSMIVDPRGAIVAEAGTQAPELLVARIDLDEVAAARKRLPWWRDRRPELYGPLVHVA
jgi:N-carbamoylputrescine amidase